MRTTPTYTQKRPGAGLLASSAEEAGAACPVLCGLYGYFEIYSPRICAVYCIIACAGAGDDITILRRGSVAILKYGYDLITGRHPFPYDAIGIRTVQVTINLAAFVRLMDKRKTLPVAICLLSVNGHYKLCAGLERNKICCNIHGSLFVEYEPGMLIS